MTLSQVTSLLLKLPDNETLQSKEIYEIDINTDSVELYFTDLNQKDLELTLSGTIKTI